MNVILHLSDPHFGTERPPVVEALARLAHAQSPQLLILSGDITQRARASEFASARTFIDRLTIPDRLVITGNHDVPLFDLAARLFFPYFRYRRVFGQDLEPVQETPDCLVVGVRTTRRYRHIEGEVSPAQIERVAQRLQQAKPHQLRIVVTHQPVHVTHAADEAHLLRGHTRAIDRWAEAGADLILGGHIHRPFMRNLRDYLPTVRRNMWVVQAGTALSTRIRHDSGNSVNLIRHGVDGNPQHCILERWDYDDAADEFVIVDTHTVERN